jgi:small-conductance mechanosensitive channel
MENVLRTLMVVGGSVVVALVLSWSIDRLLRRADDRSQDTPLWGLLRRSRQPLLIVVFSASLRLSYGMLRYPRVHSHPEAVGRVLTLVLIAAGAWLAIRAASAVAEAWCARYAASAPDTARLRRVRTQVTLIMRIVTAVVGVIAVAAMLLTFPDLRAVGTSMLASAGLIGIVAGVAAQATLGNLFAGFQIAFGDMVRIGDTVVVNGEWGVIDEVTLTYLSVRTWDERRITMPVSYFTSQPFENWSRGGAQMTGTVFFHLDHHAPIPEMRDKLRDILRDCPAWDGRDWGLAVTDTTPTTIEVRAVMTAKDASDIWSLRVTVREQLIRWLAGHHPYALPRISTAGAADVPDTGPVHPLLKDGRVPRTGLG